jgi:hypothetical protein
MRSKQKIWSESEVAILKQEYATCSSIEVLAKKMGRSVFSIRMKALNMRLERRSAVKWNNEMDKILAENYPCKETAEVARMLNLTSSQVRTRAKRLKLHKNQDILVMIRENGMFLKGHVPFNKGKKQHEYMSEEVIERSKATRFKKGQIPPNTRRIGDERINVYGYVEVKTDKGFILKHRLIWEEKNGPVPKGCILRFKNGNKQDLRIENIELLTFSQNMRANSIHNYSPDIKTAIRNIANIKRRIKKYEQNINRQTE